MLPLDPIFQPIKLGAHTVPGIWRYMFPEEILFFRVDPEKKSSCFDCPQVKAAGFHPSVRCCTVIPRVPNFLLGLSLFQEETRPLVTSYIEAGYTLPEGSNISPDLLVTSLQYIVKPDRDHPTVICPFLDRTSKHCRMYAFRSSVCSTFFCIHDRGEEGRVFWQALQDLGSQIETALSQWALGTVGFDVAGYFQRFNDLGAELAKCTESGSSAWSAYAREFLFHEWFGREPELFKRCAQAVIDHKHDLYAIASQQTILQPTHFDDLARKELVKTFPRDLVAEALPQGVAEDISNLWYSTQLSHRNLQISRFPQASEDLAD